MPLSLHFPIFLEMETVLITTRYGEASYCMKKDSTGWCLTNTRTLLAQLLPYSISLPTWQDGIEFSQFV